MTKFLKDILRDKGSTKYSITKTLALSTFLFLIVYLAYYLLWLQVAIDHTLLLELIGFTGALVGLKNNWGARNKPDTTQNAEVFESKQDSHSEDEAEF
jgi:hypothetical protein